MLSFRIFIIHCMVISSSTVRPPVDGYSAGPVAAVPVSVDTSVPIWKTSDDYLSLGLDSNLIRHKFQSFDLNSKRLKTLAKGLSPARLRVMGTDGDRMTLEKSCGQTKKKSEADKEPSVPVGTLFPDSSFIMTCADWDNLNRFALDAGWRILFGLNAQIRQDSRWDPSNAIELLDYSIKQGYAKNLDFELGNEPDLYPGWTWPHQINGTAMAQDFIFLRKMLNSAKYSEYYGNATIAGPDVAGNSGFIRDFLDAVGDAIDVITFHNYYGGSELYSVKNATDPNVLDRYVNVVTSYWNVVRLSSRPNRKIWNGETSSTYAPVNSNLYETYAAGFMLLDKLGISARLGLDLVIRQTFIGFWFALVDLGMYPTPNYWISLLYKNLVGQEVFYIHPGKYSKNVRVYAHCTSQKRSPYQAGSVVVYAMNLYDTDVVLDFVEPLSNQVIHKYHLTPYGVYTGLTAKYIALNGKIVTMPSDTELPSMEPEVLQAGSQILLTSKTMAFYVFPNVKVKACS